MSGNGKSDGMGDQLQLVMELMEKRSKGEVSNDQVEAAVSNILSGMGSGSPSNATDPSPVSDESKKRKSAPIESTTETPAEAKRRQLVAMARRIPNADHFRIKEDTANYDSSSDEEDGDAEKVPKDQLKNDDEFEFDDDEDDEVIDDGKDDEDYQDELEQIPLGKPGAQMMTTFGDGPKPAPEAVSAALLGCRRCLQVAIWDARGLRRTSKEDFSRAKKSLSTRRGGGDHTYGVDPSMLFRALSKNDKLAYDPKCGFDVEQLQKLFPEEMAAYWRWVDMKASYEESRAEQPTLEDKEGDGDNKEEEDNGKDEKLGANTKDADDESATVSGRLYERAGHFDIRTRKMKKNWYLKFAKTRQGSFLPRGRSKAQLEWDRSQPTKAGKTAAGVWHTMPAASVQFLHWAGFDPPELPPPDEITTHAMAFLAYNFLGKIVEKAIYLRNNGRLQALQKGGTEDSTNLIELQRGEQLTPKDIENAMNDPEIRPVPLFSMDKSSEQPSFQLYFGEGFEERLELEMEEFLANEPGKTLSADETRIRSEETSLFSKLAELPVVTDSVNYLMENRNEEKQSKPSAKR